VRNRAATLAPASDPLTAILRQLAACPDPRVRGWGLGLLRERTHQQPLTSRPAAVVPKPPPRGGK
jgi:hypothetical protein